MKREWLIAVVAALICLTFSAAGEARQGRRVRTPDGQRQVYRFDALTIDNGLPQNSVYAILQSRDGYLWFTTLDGLVRYDGVRFRVFNRANTRGIHSNRFDALLEGDGGEMWIGTEDGGLTRYKDGSFRTYTTQDGLPSNWVIGVRQDQDGEALISTASGYVRWKDERLAAYRSPVSKDVFVRSRPSSDAWGVNIAELRRLAGDRVPDDGIPLIELNSPYLQMHRDRQGDTWAGGTKGNLYRVRDGAVRTYTAKDGLPQQRISCILEDRSGTLWFGAAGGGLVRFQDETFTIYTTADGLSSNDIRAVCEDREGTLWIGTGDRGINRLTRQVIKVYSRRDGMSSENAYPILEDRTGRVWVGAAELIRFESGKFFSYSLKQGLPTLLVYSIFEDRQGRLWVGTTGNVGYFKDRRFTNFTARVGLLFNNVSAIHEDREGAFWFGTDVGLARVKGNTTTTYSRDNGLAGDDVHAIHEDRSGNLWFGTYGGLSLFRDGRFTSFTAKDGLVSDRVRCIYEDGDGALWIGTYDGGLSRIRDGRFTSYTTEHGLFSNGVFQILEDARGNFWMTSNQGIYRVSLAQLNDLAEGKIGQLTCVSYGKQDGLLNIECNGGRQPGGVRARDGRLWFPTQQGVAVIEPEEVQINQQPPPVVIEGVTLDRITTERHRLRPELEVGPEQQSLEIHYTGLSLIKPEHLRFRYRLEGLDADWVEAGTRRTAYYPHLPPGSYNFTVKAANSDGVWNETGASIRVVVHPPFWRTWWFTVIAAFAIAALAAVVYEWRVTRLRRAKAAQEAFSRQLISSQESERKRIAAELHDSIGQSLAIIKNLALLSLKSPLVEQRSRDQFERITEQSTQAIDEVKDISYNLRPYLLDRLGLKMAIESMISKVAAASGIEFLNRIDELENLFTNEQEINIYRIVQECVNNIVKHAEASRVTMEIHRDGALVEIVVRDNGKGFVVQESEATTKAPRGFGVFGITERAKLLGGILTMQSSPGEGTAISVKIPIGERAR
jgi:signal transduction histidine kinase/ligand-binding sensor domain-containing protein